MASTALMTAGLIMFVAGLFMFYSVALGQTDPILRIVKNAGTFTGLAGIGVILAGILLYLINKAELPIQNN